MKKEIMSSNAPKAVGPYSQAVQVGNFVFCSGQIGVDPQTNSLAIGGVETQTEQTLKNLQAVLYAAGCELKDVVKTEIFLTNMNDFLKVNEIYGRFFSEDPKPARQTIGVASLPKNAVIEISCIAYREE